MALSLLCSLTCADINGVIPVQGYDVAQKCITFIVVPFRFEVGKCVCVCVCVCACARARVRACMRAACHFGKVVCNPTYCYSLYPSDVVNNTTNTEITYPNFLSQLAHLPLPAHFQQQLYKLNLLIQNVWSFCMLTVLGSI
jgi:hypothetical protein